MNSEQTTVGLTNCRRRRRRLTEEAEEDKVNLNVIGTMTVVTLRVIGSRATRKVIVNPTGPTPTESSKSLRKMPERWEF